MTKEEACAVVQNLARVEAHETVIIRGDVTRAVFGRALAHVQPQPTESVDGFRWIVVVATIDGVRVYVHEADSVEVVG